MFVHLNLAIENIIVNCIVLFSTCKNVFIIFKDSGVGNIMFFAVREKV